LQLRDNKPDIAAPGEWSLFGGMIFKGEEPLETIKREIAEELCIDIKKFELLKFEDYYSNFEKTMIRTWFFVADITEFWPFHKLTEGQEAKSFTFEQLKDLTMPTVMKKILEYFHDLRHPVVNTKL